MKMICFYFVQKDGVTFALAKDEGEHAIGDMVKGFAYTDSKQKLRLNSKGNQGNSRILRLGRGH